MAKLYKKKRKRRNIILKIFLVLLILLFTVTALICAVFFGQPFFEDTALDLNHLMPTGTVSKNTVKIMEDVYDINSDFVDFQYVTADEFELSFQRICMMPNLTRVNLMRPDGSSSVSFEQYIFLRQEFPTISFDYTITEFEGTSFVYSDKEIDVSNVTSETLDYLASYFYLFPNISHLNMVSETGDTLITPEKYLDFKAQYPNFTYTYYIADLFGQKVDENTDYLNLSSITASDIPFVLESLTFATNIKQINLNKGDNTSNLSYSEAAQIISAIPGVVADYPINNFFGYSFNSMDKEVYIQNVYIGDENQVALCEVLSIMTGGTRFVLDECGLSNELMAELRDTYRSNVKLVWRVHCGTWFDRLTDINSIWTNATGCINDNNSYNLRYFEDLQYVDLGHHQQMTDISWLYYTPKVEAIIFSECQIKDLTPIASLKNLWYLEIYDAAFTDISCLSDVTTLEHINIGGTRVTDISPLYNLKNLKRARFTNMGQITDQQKAELREAIPKCVAIFDAGYCYMGNWRKNEDVMNEYDPIYLYIRECFGYDLNNSTGVMYFYGEKPNTDDFYARCWQAYHNAGYF